MNRRNADDQMDLAIQAPWISSVADTDDDTLALAARTQPEALAELFERYHDRVYRYVFHRMRDRWEAEDITGIVFVRVAEALPRFRSERGAFVPWLFRIAHNAIIDSYRRRRLTSMSVPLEDMADDDFNGRHLHELAERESMQARLTLLSEDQREVITLRFMADLSYSEIAITLDKSEAAVRMVMHRGLRRLRELCEGEESDGRTIAR